MNAGTELEPHAAWEADGWRALAAEYDRANLLMCGHDSEVMATVELPSLFTVDHTSESGRGSHLPDYEGGDG